MPANNSRSVMKFCISQRRPLGVPIYKRLGRIIQHLNGIPVLYDLSLPTDSHQRLRGRGLVNVDNKDDLVGCRITGEIFCPSPFEMSFHTFWLNRRGMILLTMGLLDEFTSEKLMPNASYIQPIHFKTWKSLIRRGVGLKKSIRVDGHATGDVKCNQLVTF